MSRRRTITDNVLEAIKNGVDHETIRELGELHSELLEAYHQTIYDLMYGSLHTVHHIHVLAKLILEPDQYEKLREKDARDLAETCLLEIQFRLVGHYEDEIR